MLIKLSTDKTVSEAAAALQAAVQANHFGVHTFILKEVQMKLTLKSLIAAVLIASALHAGAAFAQTEGASVRAETGVAQTPQASTMAATCKTNPLASGAEIFENLTEASPVLDAVGFKKSLSEFDALSRDFYASVSGAKNAVGQLGDRRSQRLAERRSQDDGDRIR